MMPLVSVIVPNYNHADYLDQRLQSVFNQTFPDFEVIILDDCSTDNSIQVINRYAGHPKVSRIMVNAVNSGSPFQQWIKGIDLSAGKYVWIAESDDWCETNFLGTVMEGMLVNARCVVAYCQSYCITQANTILWQSGHTALQEFQQGGEFVEKHLLHRQAIFNASMGVWKKEAFDNISRAFTSYKFCGDWLFWIELCMQGEVFISGKLLNYFRKHNQDVSGGAYKSGLNFEEEPRIIHYLHATGIISYGIYMQMLKSKFLAYKLTGNNLPPDKKAAIEKIFFPTPEIKSRIRSFYYSWKVRHTITKWFTAKARLQG